LIGKLNKYIHISSGSFLETTKHECPRCPAAVKLNKEDYEQCAKLFQDRVAYFISILHAHLEALAPEELKEGEMRNIVGHVTSLKVLEKEMGEKLILSDEYRKLIEELSKIYGE